MKNFRRSKFGEKVDQFKIYLIIGYLKECNGNVKRVEIEKGVPRPTFYRLIKKFNINVNDYRK